MRDSFVVSVSSHIMDDRRDSYWKTLSVENHHPYPLPKRPWSVAQRWRDLLFAHWPVAAHQLAPLLPPGIEIDTFDQSAWVGVVPFWMDQVKVRGLPRIPGAIRFPELNFRTYVRERNTNRALPFHSPFNKFPATWFQTVQPVFVVVLSPVFAWIWLALGRRKTEPSSPAKFALGLLLAGLAFAILVPPAGLAVTRLCTKAVSSNIWSWPTVRAPIAAIGPGSR